jgi:SNF2 family DNA or RNA helicase
MKKDINHQLPKKTEQILFCKLTEYQIELYQTYLEKKKKILKELKELDNEKKKKKNIFFCLILDL